MMPSYLPCSLKVDKRFEQFSSGDVSLTEASPNAGTPHRDRHLSWHN